MLGAPVSQPSPQSGRRRHHRPYSTKNNVTHLQGPAWTFGRRLSEELDTCASNNPFFCKTGTHRCPQGEELLTDLRVRDDSQIEQLVKEGRQWKVPPGPGAYRTTRTIGDGEPGSDLNLDEVNIDLQPLWTIGRARRQKIYHTLGTRVDTDKPYQHEGRIDVPKTRFNLTPGPAYYFTGSDCGPSVFLQKHMGETEAQSGGPASCAKRPGTPAADKRGGGEEGGGGGAWARPSPMGGERAYRRGQWDPRADMGTDNPQLAMRRKGRGNYAKYLENQQAYG